MASPPREKSASSFPKARILMLTTYDGDDDIHKALSAGAAVIC